MIRTRKRFGFTLIEVLVSTVLIGVAISALLAANGSSTRVNGAGVDMTTGEFLLEQIRELTAVLPIVDPTDAETFGPEEPNLVDYDDIYDFNSVNPLCPPIDASGAELIAFSSFSQQISVENVSANNFSLSDPNSPFIRVTVSVRQNGTEVCNASWIRAQY
jgi:prepilin-type N-terminal cleavage/methylation domain-containing protein